MFVAWGYFEQTMSLFTGKTPEMDPGNARYMSVNAWYDSSKAIKELDYNVIPVTKLIDDAYDWYKENGYF